MEWKIRLRIAASIRLFFIKLDLRANDNNTRLIFFSSELVHRIRWVDTGVI